MIEEIKTFESRKEELIKQGKEKGFITYEELAQVLKGLELDSDNLDSLYNAFVENGIEIVTEEVGEIGEDEDEGDDDFEKILSDHVIAKELTINDPVRMYLKEIGKISLLSLEEELKLSERIAHRKDAFGADFFENENWYILPLMVGMDRVEDSRRRILSNHKVISIDIEENDFFSIKARCVPDMTEKVLWNEMMREISDLLNERQRYAVIAYYCEGASQAEIAKNLEISQQAASGLIQRALVIIRNYMQVNPSDVKRKRNKK